MLTDIDTSLGTYWVSFNQRGNQIGIRDLKQVGGPPGDGVFSWNLNMVEVLEAACHFHNATIQVASPGGYKIIPDDHTEEIIEKLKELAERRAAQKPGRRWTKPL